MASFPLLILTVLVVVRELVDRIVGQVNKIVVHIVPGRSRVRLCTESSESHLMKIDTQWVHSVDHHVESQVILKVVD